jgi:hypothetical protein
MFYTNCSHILVLLYFAELSCLCNFLVESVNAFFRPRFDFRTCTSDILFYQQTILHMRKRFPEEESTAITISTRFISEMIVFMCP